MQSNHTRPVEIERTDGTTEPGLEWLPYRRREGVGETQQARTLVIVSRDGSLLEVNIAQDRVASVDDEQAALIENVIEPQLGDGDE